MLGQTKTLRNKLWRHVGELRWVVEIEDVMRYSDGGDKTPEMEREMETGPGATNQYVVVFAVEGGSWVVVIERVGGEARQTVVMVFHPVPHIASDVTEAYWRWREHIDRLKQTNSCCQGRNSHAVFPLLCDE